jgi:arylsulfatase A-like enzyme
MRSILAVLLGSCAWASALAATRPNIIFVMADDMGWGQAGYRGHPVLKTPHLDAMAAEGLRLERFYAGAPVCSPTRASVLTGRSNDRAGVRNYGFALRLQEKTIAQALQKAGYVTGHFGKWHLNGYSGPGAPILGDDPLRPSVFGFDEWVSVSNFFDQSPLMSRGGKIEQFDGDSSEVAMDVAIDFLKKHRGGERPMFAVVWYGSPHSPFRALPADKALFEGLEEPSANHYGELVAMDRSLGRLRQTLRELGIADNTLLVFCSDNGGLPGIMPDTVGGLRGNKGTVYEGGLRVPGIIEWPGVIAPRITNYPASTMDLFPTVADILDLPAESFVQPVDGVSLKPLFTAGLLLTRMKPIPFRYQSRGALIDNRYKVLTNDLRSGPFELYDLEADPQEANDLSGNQPELLEIMKKELLAWNASVDASFAGRDYPAGEVVPPDVPTKYWCDTPGYQPYLGEWKERWEFRSYIESRATGAKETGAKKGKSKK